MAASIFARIGTIKGESRDAKHKDEIEVLSWSWGLFQSDTIAHGGGGGAGRRASRPQLHASRRQGHTASDEDVRHR